MHTSRPARALAALAALTVASAAGCTAPPVPAPVPSQWSERPWPADPTVETGACPTSTSCYVVHTSAGVPEHWDGRDWAPLPVTSPPGAEWSFARISCPTATTCLLGGTRTVPGDGSSPGTPLLLRWDGTAVSEIPLDLGAGTRGGVSGLSCPSVSWCMVSAFGGGGGPLAVWDGATMRATAPPAGLTVGSGVSCGAPTNCTAPADQDGRRGLAHWDGTRWAFVPVATPTGRAPVLDGTSCSGPSFCVAVGRETTNLVDLPYRSTVLVATWSGGDWSPFRAIPGALRFGSIRSVSCGTPQWCVAVGKESPDGGGGTSFTLVWTGAGWARGAPPLPNHNLGTISCAAGERWCANLVWHGFDTFEPLAG